jgi:hypothetical protein
VFALGCGLFTLRALDLWRDPYQIGREWQSFDIARELERVHGVPWATELSTMSGGTRPAPFLQEFPLAQYAAWLLKASTAMSQAEAGQAVATAVAALSAVVWVVYASSLPVSGGLRLLIGGLIFFVPGFLRYGETAVPDAVVFLINLCGVCLIVSGKRRAESKLIVVGAVLVGLGVLGKTTAAPAATTVVLALLLVGHWRAAVALAGAMLPGFAWAVLSRSINQQAASVNEFARVGLLPGYWWNPRLYLDPWWARSLAFTLYDVLGAFGLLACIWLWLTAKDKGSLQSLLMILPAAATILAFNYHSASHRYYTLIWLPFTLTGAVELATERLRATDRRRSYAVILVAAAGLAIFSVAERQAGLAERFVARQADAAQPFFHGSGAASQRTPHDETRRLALSELKSKRALFVAYLGNGLRPFLDLDMRGWVVEADSTARAQRRHLPESIIRAGEQFQLSEHWFRERLARGMDAALIERAGAFDTVDVLQWARSAGLRDATNHPAGHILLLAPPRSEH